jgi:hypothetical protein
MPAGGTRAAGFDFTAYMRRVCDTVVRQNEELSHIDMGRVAVAFCQARKRVNYGLFASLTPLRFKDGAEVQVRRGRQLRIQRLVDTQGVEMLYILRFYLPRFLDIPFREKLITIFHELWHVSPAFDGDLRRHAGRCYAHTHSQAEYDEQMGLLADRWLEKHQPTELVMPLQHTFATLARQHKVILGLRLPRPRLIPCVENSLKSSK